WHHSLAALEMPALRWRGGRACWHSPSAGPLAEDRRGLCPRRAQLSTCRGHGSNGGARGGGGCAEGRSLVAKSCRNNGSGPVRRGGQEFRTPGGRRRRTGRDQSRL